MPKEKDRASARDKAIQIIRQGGIHPRTLYQLRDAGDLELISRGV